MSGAAVNPFDDLIVRDPRQPESIVRGLNEKPLLALVAEFEKLNEGEAPRPTRRVAAAQLVTSAQPGYGKSHLIGRLFRELESRATIVYVRPFQNPLTVFQSLLLAVAQEMDFPEGAGRRAWDRGEPTQFDLLAHAVLAHTVADLVEHGKDVKAEGAELGEITARMRSDTMAAFNRGQAGWVWADWLRDHFDKLLPLFEEAMARRGIKLSRPAAWLRMLYAYAFNPFDLALRRACLDWMGGQPVASEEAVRMGLGASDLASADIDPEGANQICRVMLADLCALAIFFRPFVFCFDQTEVYGHHPPLARAFGLVVARLVDEASNHLTLITSNQDPWTARIVPNLEEADLDRIAQPPLPLSGLGIREAADLIQLRVKASGTDAEEAAALLDAGWLKETFPTEGHQIGARQFLKRCRERWDRAPKVLESLSELYEQRREKLLASPKRHRFEPDTLQWLVAEAAQGVEGVEIGRLAEKYASVQWTTPSRTCYFGFVGGAHWAQWRAIAQAAVLHKKGNSRPCKSIFFRTPELARIPGPTWRIAGEIERAKKAYLQIIELDTTQVAELYAARELFVEAAQGDIEQGVVETLSFLRTRLAPWWNRLKAPIAGGEEQGAGAETEATEAGPAANQPDLANRVRRLVEDARCLAMTDVLKAIGGKVTAEQVLAACGFSPEIRVRTRPSETLLEWQLPSAFSG